jgi:lysozyme
MNDLPKEPYTYLPPMAASIVKGRLRVHEGVRARAYRDSRGIWTIGIGRNLEANGLSEDEIELLFQNDYMRAAKGASTIGVWPMLDDTRKGVLVEMVFQMGLSRVLQFRLFLAALQRKDWAKAAAEMKDSAWFKQTPGRVERLAGIIATGNC